MTKHVWEKIEIVLTAQKDYADPYNEVDVWIDLKGPGFDRRVYGFWDGGHTHIVRILASAEGAWSWTSGSNQDDAGLNNQEGAFTAVAWTEEEKKANANRRGYVRPTANGHALEYADGEPAFLIGDTWYSTPSWRYIWYDDDEPRPFDETMGFKDMVRFRKQQGYNSIAIIASLHNWVNDGLDERVVIDDGKNTLLRAAWVDPETGSPKAMHNEGGTPFAFPGLIPGYEQSYPNVHKLNPDYFKYMDRKIDYLVDNGFIPFIETLRRDSVPAWKAYYDWPNSFIRYTNYIFARYQASHAILSPVHMDIVDDSIHPREYNALVAEAYARQGPPAFGALVTTNAGPSTLTHFGDDDEAPWITLHQIGNMREHEYYWYLTEIFRAKKAKPALHGEPYYSAWGINVEYYPVRAQPNTPQDDRYVRNGMYGSFLSGGLSGYLYGATGLIRAEREKGCKPGEKPYSHWMWDAMLFTSAEMVKPFAAFALSEGRRYQDLIPESDWVTPSKTHDYDGFDGWAYCAGTPEKDLYMIYYEKGCPSKFIRSVLNDGLYKATWFDPRTGAWIDAGILRANSVERMSLPPKPTDDDWCLKLVLTGQAERGNG